MFNMVSDSNYLCNLSICFYLHIVGGLFASCEYGIALIFNQNTISLAFKKIDTLTCLDFRIAVTPLSHGQLRFTRASNQTCIIHTKLRPHLEESSHSLAPWGM